MYVLDSTIYLLRTYVNAFLKVRSLEFTHELQKQWIYQSFSCFSFLDLLTHTRVGTERAPQSEALSPKR